MIIVGAETNTRVSSGIDPARSRVYQRARAEVRQTYLDRAAKGTLRWSSTLFPTNAYAQDAEMSVDALADFIFDACLLNEPDPVARLISPSASNVRQLLSDKLKRITLSEPPVANPRKPEPPLSSATFFSQMQLVRFTSMSKPTPSELSVPAEIRVA